MNGIQLKGPRSLAVSGLVVLALVAAAIASKLAVSAQSTVEAYVPSGSSSSSIWPDSSDLSPRCFGDAYTWTHGFAWSINTDTSNRIMTMYYLDFYGGSTSPNPPSSGISYVWGDDSWVYGDNPSQSWKFGALSSFYVHSFYSYDITIWQTKQYHYASGGYVTIDAEFGAYDPWDVISGSCYGRSTVELHPY